MGFEYKTPQCDTSDNPKEHLISGLGKKVRRYSKVIQLLFIRAKLTTTLLSRYHIKYYLIFNNIKYDNDKYYDIIII